MFKKFSRSISVFLAALMVVANVISYQAPVKVQAASVAQDLFFSEYIEGSSNNKALEIYNGTGKDVDLSEYAVVQFNNGASQDPTDGKYANVLELTGTLTAGDVFVIGNSQAVDAIISKADITGKTYFYGFNGDDAIALFKNYNSSTRQGTIIDVIGKIGERKVWGTGETTTKDHTMVRKATILSGDTNGADAFDPSVEWDGYAKNTFDYLGSHTVDESAIGTLPGSQNVMDVKTARAKTAGTEVTIKGIITSLDGKIFIQDATGGINLYKGDISGVAIGDLVKVTGTIAVYKGLEEIKDFTIDEIISTNNDLPIAEELAVDAISDTYEGQRIVVKDITIIEEDTYHNFIGKDEKDNTLLIDPKASNSDNWLEVGKTYKHITGILSCEYNKQELMPVSTEGIVVDTNGSEIPVTDLEEYYKTTQGLTGEALKAELNAIIDDHTPLSYSEAYDKLIETDKPSENSNDVVLFYKGTLINGPAKYDNGNGWNREHVWAKSHGNFGTSAGAGTDLHQLRPTDVSVNSDRGHLDFDNGGIYHHEATECKYDDDSWEPRDEVKGDVARILFYMATRYEVEDGGLDLELSESLDSVSATTNTYGEHGKLSTLLAWHKADPVSDFERTRNNKVHTFQGNRNPYIDHPEWVELIWSENNALSANTDVVEISTARGKVKDTEVTVEGIVTHKESGTLLYIQDTTGGIKVDTYGKNVDLNSYSVGDKLQVSGKVDVYKGEVEVSVESASNITVKSSNNNLPVPREITVTELKDGQYQGELVKLPLVKVTGVGKYSIDVVNGDKEGTDIYHAKAGSSFNAEDYEDGDWISVIGIAAWYYDEQIKLRQGGDFVIQDAPTDPNASLPIILNMKPANMSTVYDTEVTVSATIEETVNPIAENSIKMILDGKEVIPTVHNNKVAYNTTQLTFGEHDVKIFAKDTSGKEVEANWYFVVQDESVEYDFYFGIPHCHTEYSDGKGTPTDAFKYGYENGLDWMFITDHSNWYDGVKYEPKTSAFADKDSAYHNDKYDTNFEYNKATNQYEEKEGSEWYKTRMEVEAFNEKHDDFVAFRGFEMTFSDVGHINVIDSDAYVEAKAQMSSLTDFYNWVDTLSEKQDDTVLASFNHPNWPGDSFYNQAYVPELDQEFSMMEVGNGAPPYSYARSEEQFIRALDNGWHVGATNAQDNHSTNWGDPDNLTAVIASELSEEGIKEAITNRRIYSTETRNLELKVKANGYWMGSVVDIANGEELVFDIEAKDYEEPIKKLQIMTNGGAIIAEKVLDEAEPKVVWNPSITVPSGAHWYVVKVIHENGKWGTASPIFTPESDNDVKFTKLDINPDITLSGYETELKATVANMGLRSVSNVEVKFYVGSIDENNLIGTSIINNIPAGENKKAETTWIPTVSGEVTIIAEMTEIKGVTTVTEIAKTIHIVPANGKTVMIDTAHGNYDAPGGIGEFISLLRQYGYTVVMNSNPITLDTLKGVDVFVATQPRGNEYSEAELDDLGTWTFSGGSLLLAGKSNYSDDPTRFNKLLEICGSTIRFNDDNVYEPEDSEFYNGGMVWSVYSYNLPETNSKLNENMEAIRMFSSSSLVNPNGEALVNNAETGLEILLAGNKSSYNFSVGKQTGNGFTYNEAGNLNGETIPMIAKENVQNGKVAVAGRHFFSDFEIVNDVSNTALTLKLIDWLADCNRIRTIKEVREDYAAGRLKEGDTVTVKGTATVNEEVFFDVIYIQDETSGISLYGSYQDNPADVLEGTEVIATGKIKVFEGEMELQYDDYNTSILYVGYDEVKEPKVLSTIKVMDAEYTGMLVATTGSVIEINEKESYFKVDDGSGTAYIHVDGYVGVDMSKFEAGDSVVVTGIASVGRAGARIRVRGNKDIVVVDDQVTPPAEETFIGFDKDEIKEYIDMFFQSEDGLTYEEMMFVKDYLMKVKGTGDASDEEKEDAIISVFFELVRRGYLIEGDTGNYYMKDSMTDEEVKNLIDFMEQYLDKVYN